MFGSGVVRFHTEYSERRYRCLARGLLIGGDIVFDSRHKSPPG